MEIIIFHIHIITIINSFWDKIPERMPTTFSRKFKLYAAINYIKTNRKRKNQKPLFVERVAESYFSINVFEMPRFGSENFIH